MRGKNCVKLKGGEDQGQKLGVQEEKRKNPEEKKKGRSAGRHSDLRRCKHRRMI